MGIVMDVFIKKLNAHFFFIGMFVLFAMDCLKQVKKPLIL